jgi:hypothetical protein
MKTQNMRESNNTLTADCYGVYTDEWHNYRLTCYQVNSFHIPVSFVSGNQYGSITLTATEALVMACAISVWLLTVYIMQRLLAKGRK